MALLVAVLNTILYWLLGTSVQKEALWPVIVSLFLSARGNSGIEIVGESFSTTRENKEVLAHVAIYCSVLERIFKVASTGLPPLGRASSALRPPGAQARMEASKNRRWVKICCSNSR